MAFNEQKRTARNLLAAIENGALDTTDTFAILEREDPTLVYFIFKWLRASYPPSHPAAEAVLGRLGELCSEYPVAARMAAQGGSDSVVEWFEDAFEYRDFRANEFIDLIVEKLEG